MVREVGRGPWVVACETWRKRHPTEEAAKSYKEAVEELCGCHLEHTITHEESA